MKLLKVLLNSSLRRKPVKLNSIDSQASLIRLQKLYYRDRDKYEEEYEAALHRNNIPLSQTSQSSFWRKVLVRLSVAMLIYALFNRNSIKQRFSLEDSLLNAMVFKEEILPQNNITTQFSDVIGIDEHRDQLAEVVDFLKDPQKYHRMGAVLPHGLLLSGPPGTGKTLLAKALAGEAKCNFFYRSGAQFDEVFVGVGSKRVKSLFAKAKQMAPSIIFIDEIDSIAGKRDSKLPSTYRDAINQLLAQMDGFDQVDNVIVIGATNLEQSLDQAIRRPGRFDKVIHVPLPDKKGRRDLLSFYLGKIKYDPTLDIDNLAAETQGFSGADIQNFVNTAILNAVKEGEQQANPNHFDFALERVAVGVKSRRKVSSKERLATAVHEGGHALVALLTKHAPTVKKVTILGAGQAKGYTSFLDVNQKKLQSMSEVRALIDVLIGARVAEQLLLGQKQISSGCSDDLKKATKYVYQLLTLLGEQGSYLVLDPNGHYSDQFKFQMDMKAKGLLDQSYRRVKQLVNSHKTVLRRIAQRLVEKETMTGVQIKAMM